MLEARATVDDPSKSSAWNDLDALSSAAFRLDPPMPHERSCVLREEAATLVDRLLARVARSRGALDIALGEGLAALAVGDRVLRLGFSGIGDYARERLGIAGRTAQTMVRLARELRGRPLLGEAVRRGEVSARKAQVVLPVAAGADEAAWVDRARVETVRALEHAVGEVRAAGSGDDTDDEPWERIVVSASPSARAALEEAMALAGAPTLLGAAAPRWQRLEVICQEYLGAFAVEPIEGERDAPGLYHGDVASDVLDVAKAALEEETGRWAFLADVAAVGAPAAACGGGDPCALDEELRRLAALRDRWGEVLGRCAMLVKLLGLWREMGFASLGHYCAERLGLAERTVEQRAWLERRLFTLPPLRAAMRAGAVSYEQARLVAGVADDATVEGWIEQARATTCIELRRRIEARTEGREETQMCAPRELDLRVPARVSKLLDAALRAARKAAGAPLTTAECLERVARHFIETWADATRERKTLARRVLERDRGLCTAPGCSRAAVQAHHLTFRSHGGADEPRNLTSLCASHHLHGVHRGYVRVSGEAPDALVWELGMRGRTGKA